MRRKKVYIHYGATKFDPNHPLGGGWCGKPNGLWASPKYTEYGWVQWCHREEYHTERLNKHFKFRLQKGTKILEIRCLDDIVPYLTDDDKYAEDRLKYPDLFKYDPTWGRNIDIEKLKENFDGMEVFMTQNWSEMRSSLMFSAYDVDSLVIWNLDKVIQM